MSVSSAMPTLPIELHEGASGPDASVGPITRTDIVRYAGEEFARAAGMPTVFSIGMHTAGVLAQYLAQWVGQPNVRRLSVRFTGQVWPGDTLTLGGRVAGVEEAGAERLAQLELQAARQTGDIVLKGSAVVRVA